ncbi:MAG: CBS domain-containing protein [Mariprofundaceae bacterium]
MTKGSDFLLGGVTFRHLRASQVMETDVVVSHAHATWQYMTELMTGRGFASLPVVDDDHRLLGIVREDDLIMAILDGKSLNALSAGDIMLNEPPFASRETPVDALMELMRSTGCNVIPVLDEGRLVGLVTRRDMLTAHLHATAEPPKTL